MKHNMHTKVAVKSSCGANSRKKGEKITLPIKHAAKSFSVLGNGDALSYRLFLELFSNILAICNPF